MKISKRSDERPSLRVSTTFQKFLEKEKNCDYSSTFCEIDSYKFDKKLNKTLKKDNNSK